MNENTISGNELKMEVGVKLFVFAAVLRLLLRSGLTFLFKRQLNTITSTT